MTQSPYQAMAKEFLDLWQKQVASVVSDKQFIQAMLEMIESMKMPNVNSAAQPSQPSDASGTDAAERVQLAYRLAMCERRLAALETATGKKARAPKPRKRPAQGSKKPKQ